MINIKLKIKSYLILLFGFITLISCHGKTAQSDICSQPGQCQGTFINQTVTESETKCQQLCYYDSECQWYTFEQTLNLCVLTSTCSPQTSNNAVYGQKECFQGDPSKTDI